MSGTVRPFACAVAAVMALMALIAIACRDRKAPPESLVVVSAGESGERCGSDSLRPAVAAPAEGLWLYERPASRQRVAARIGPPRPDDGKLVITRPVETMEVTETADTIRQRLDAARVSLEILPPFGRATLGLDRATDSTASSHPTATYAPSPQIRLAAYEPCVTSSRGPRTRYLRRDGAGRVVTDVMLTRASDR